MRTSFTELLNIKYPVMSAPMTNHSGGRLAAAVSKAGGLGSFGAVSAGGQTWVENQIEFIRSQTDNPFAVGFLTQYLPEYLPIFHAVLEQQVPAIAFSFANPDPWLKQAKASGALTLCQVQDLRSAEAAARAGTDILVAQGNAAGGHTGTQNLLPFLSAVLERYPEIPILAAGGVCDGRTLAAVLAAGASGVWMGTTFAATDEAVEIPEQFKRVIVNSDGEDTSFTRLYDLAENGRWPEGVGARVYRNDLVRRWESRENEILANQEEIKVAAAEAWQAHNPNLASVYMGPSAGAVNSVLPAADFLVRVCQEAEDILRKRCKELL